MKKLFIFAFAALGLLACTDQNLPSGTKNKEGALSGVFSISPTRKVHFSQGNLQYCPLYNEWRFAENQYDFIGWETYDKRSVTYGYWIDLFAWGTSGCNEAIMPYSKYYPYYEDENGNRDPQPIPDIATNRDYDWGVYNPISNGGNQKGAWRTPTADDLNYIFAERANCSALCGFAIVNEVEGVIILPDAWKTPNGIQFVSMADLKYVLTYENGFSFGEYFAYLSPEYTDNAYNNVYNVEQWKKMETAGAVFLPLSDNGYWTISPVRSSNGMDAWSLGFWVNSAIVLWQGDIELYKARSVRLIQDIE